MTKPIIVVKIPFKLWYVIQVKDKMFNFLALLDITGLAEQVWHTQQLPDQSYRNPQFKKFHCLLDTLIALAN